MKSSVMKFRFANCWRTKFFLTEARAALNNLLGNSQGGLFEWEVFRNFQGGYFFEKLMEGLFRKIKQNFF